MQFGYVERVHDEAARVALDLRQQELGRLLRDATAGENGRARLLVVSRAEPPHDLRAVLSVARHGAQVGVRVDDSLQVLRLTATSFDIVLEPVEYLLGSPARHILVQGGAHFLRVIHAHINYGLC